MQVSYSFLLDSKPTTAKILKKKKENVQVLRCQATLETPK